MAKPVFRYTVGPCRQQGLNILAESIKKTTQALGVNNFDWLICYNGLSHENVDFIRKSIGDLPIQLFAQNWIDCPVEDVAASPVRDDGTYEWNGNKCGGTMWKVCPARVRMESHEIIMDNDIVLLKKFRQIDEFLSSDKVLILEEPIRFYGKYDHLFDDNHNLFLNSGFMGLPPGYDFAKHIKSVWSQNGSIKHISQADEQGLLTYTLNQNPSIRIKKEQMYEVLAKDYNAKITGNEEGIHFTQANRIPSHRGWNLYQMKMNNLMVIEG